jgi:FkbM family methyltransferase
MSEVRPGDTIVDVGAHVGLYSIAFARRAGCEGRVHAFEPDPANFARLEAQCRINGVADRVSLYPTAVSDTLGRVGFVTGHGSESHIGADESQTVNCVRLDAIFAGRPVDLVKIDVEGFEEAVLRGAAELLTDQARAPRLIAIEVHPYAWPAVGTTTGSLLALLARCGYTVRDLSGRTVNHLQAYGQVLARRDV